MPVAVRIAYSTPQNEQIGPYLSGLPAAPQHQACSPRLVIMLQLAPRLLLALTGSLDKGHHLLQPCRVLALLLLKMRTINLLQYGVLLVYIS